jgi:hypothetical protein
MEQLERMEKARNDRSFLIKNVMKREFVKDRIVNLNIRFGQVFQITRLSEYEGTILA